MTVISDTGPLIALAKVDQLILLETLFGRVCIPPAVHRELFAKYGPESAQLDEALLGFMQVAPLPAFSPEVKIVTLRLDVGEQQAIALAYEQDALLVIDDRMGRVAARRLGLTIIGLVGVLIQAREAGLVPAVSPLLSEIRQRGYWLSDEILKIAASLAGET